MGGDIEGCGFQVVGNSVLDNDDDGLCTVWKKKRKRDCEIRLHEIELCSARLSPNYLVKQLLMKDFMRSRDFTDLTRVL